VALVSVFVFIFVFVCFVARVRVFSPVIHEEERGRQKRVNNERKDKRKRNGRVRSDFNVNVVV
jgi:preprotein translocase subunit SecY